MLSAVAIGFVQRRAISEFAGMFDLLVSLKVSCVLFAMTMCV